METSRKGEPGDGMSRAPEKEDNSGKGESIGSMGLSRPLSNT